VITQLFENRLFHERRRRPVCRALVPVLACAALLPAAAGATSVAPMDLRQMVVASPDIVHATVVSSSSHWNAAHTLVVTETRLQVRAALKGNASGEMTVLTPGGRVGKLLVEVPGAVPLAPGEEAILFLVPDTRGNRYVAGLNRGRFEVTTDPKTGAKVVQRLGGELQALAGAAASKAASAGTGRPLALEPALGALRDLIQDVAAKGGW
jgi:hypothetical protein